MERLPSPSPAVALLFVVIFVAGYLWAAVRLLNDLYQPERQVNGDKNMWALIIIFGSVVGMLAYVFYGRIE